MTPNELKERIKDFSQRFYSDDTPVECQDKLIEILKEDFKGIKAIETEKDLLKLQKNKFRILIIQNAEKIINQLQDLTPLEELNRSDTVFLLFFNGRIIGEKRREDWLDFLEKAKDLIKVTINCNGPGGNGNGGCFLISLVEWLKRIFIKIKSFFNNPKTKKTLIKLIKILLFLFNGLGAAILIAFLSGTFKCS